MPLTTSRRSLLGLATVMGWACFAHAAPPPADLDASLLRAEDVQERVRALPKVAVRAGSAGLVRQYHDRAEAEAHQVAAIAADSFKPDAAMTDITARLAALPPPPDAAGVAAVLDRFAAAQAALHALAATLPLAALQARSTELERTLKARPDRAAIAALPPLMIAPDLAAETVLVGQRLKLAIGFRFNGDLEKLRGTDLPTINAALDAALLQERKTLAQPIGEPDLDLQMARGMVTGSITGALIGMPPGDVARLLRFYRSLAGRARHQATVDGFRAYAEAGARATVLAALLRLRNPPTDSAAAPIGTATMLPDGTIVLQLRAESPGALGDAKQRYTPADPRYTAICDHLPGLQAGGNVPVPPFE